VLDTPEENIDEIAIRADTATAAWAGFARHERASALRAVADRLDAAAEELVPVAIAESHLSEARLRGELTRTTFQLRLLAETAEDGGYLDARVDHPDPDWPMGSRPDLRRVRVALGPVVVFAASNFPFAFSVAGGDTASALAAGCAVILKAHPGHPQLSAMTARCANEALDQAGAPEGLFQIIYGERAGVAALQHPKIKAGAFTGSLSAGRALFDIAVGREEPIPFYGELSSVNPVFVTAARDAGQGPEIAQGLLGSFTLGAGQFCTKPGVVLVPEGSRVLRALSQSSLPAPAPLLNERITDGYLAGQRQLREHPEVRVLIEGAGALTDPPAPTVLATTATALLHDPEALIRECFGPLMLVAEYRDERQLLEVAAVLEGQLTATIVAEDDDAVVPELMNTLATRAGRLLWNQWPTGVSVSYAQQHGGPYPATTAPSTTSVGTAAIDRFTRPVAFQGFPTSLLPAELQDDADLPRRVDGQLRHGPGVPHVQER
jgi:NADP-dependent aldehyde dehydrogenase